MGCQRDGGEGNPRPHAARGPGSRVLGPKSAFLPGRGPAPSRRGFLSPPPRPRMKPVASSPPRPRGDEGTPSCVLMELWGQGISVGRNHGAKKPMGWVGLEGTHSQSPTPISPLLVLKPLPRVPAPQSQIKVTPGPRVGQKIGILAPGPAQQGQASGVWRGHCGQMGKEAQTQTPGDPNPAPCSPVGAGGC